MQKKIFEAGLSTMKIILITVGVLGALIGGSIFYFQKHNTADPKQVEKPTPDPLRTGLNLPDTNPTIVADTKTSGRLEGTFTYHDKTLPKTMKACAENLSNGSTICSGSLKETGFKNTFSFEVPDGKYYVYAISGVEGEEWTRAYYTELETCGLQTCITHNKVTITVGKNETVSGIKPQDWNNITPTP